MKCPNCGNNVYAVDTLDTEYDSGSYYDVVEGICSNCGKIWEWTEVFTFDRAENIHEVKENGHL